MFFGTIFVLFNKLSVVLSDNFLPFFFQVKTFLENKFYTINIPKDPIAIIKTDSICLKDVL